MNGIFCFKPTDSVILQALVFLLVSAGFTSIYLIQPVLPVLQVEFGVDAQMASYSVSAVILGIALSNLPFGRLSDRYPVKPIIGTGGLVVSFFGILCAFSDQINYLIFFRFVQGLFIPALTTCLIAYLSRSLPRRQLNTIMGSYVSATVIGGLGGRLLGGWIHTPLHWRYAFFTSSALLSMATIVALFFLPKEKREIGVKEEEFGFLALLIQPWILKIYVISFSAFFVFSAVFNYLPFYLAGEHFRASTNVITLMYLAYVVGVIIAPVSGKLSNRLGNGSTIILGTLILGFSITITHVPSLTVVAIGLAGICAGFFTIHASAAGSMNRKLESSRGRANSLYVLFYYIGGASGITVLRLCFTNRLVGSVSRVSEALWFS